jgi:hypothetical protein
MVRPEEPIIVNFDLKYELLKSPIDEMMDEGLLRSGLAFLAKTVKGVKSTYRLEAEASVKGTKFNPIDKKDIQLI